jgi:hypothetical protein
METLRNIPWWGYVGLFVLVFIMFTECTSEADKLDAIRREQASNLLNRIGSTIYTGSWSDEFKNIKEKAYEGRDTLFHVETLDFKIIIIAKKTESGEYVEVPEEQQDTIIQVKKSPIDWASESW